MSAATKISIWSNLITCQTSSEYMGFMKLVFCLKGLSL